MDRREGSPIVLMIAIAILAFVGLYFMNEPEDIIIHQPRAMVPVVTPHSLSRVPVVKSKLVLTPPLVPKLPSLVPKLPLVSTPPLVSKLPPLVPKRMTLPPPIQTRPTPAPVVAAVGVSSPAPAVAPAADAVTSSKRAVEAVKLLEEAASSKSAIPAQDIIPVAKIAVEAAKAAGDTEGVSAIKALAAQAMHPSAGEPAQVAAATQAAIKAVKPAVNWAGYKFSTNERCGPKYGNKACPGKQCCSIYGVCGGSTGKKDLWCGKFKGFDGKYNGEKPYTE